MKKKRKTELNWVFEKCHLVFNNKDVFKWGGQIYASRRKLRRFFLSLVYFEIFASTIIFKLKTS